MIFVLEPREMVPHPDPCTFHACNALVSVYSECRYPAYGIVDGHADFGTNHWAEADEAVPVQQNPGSNDDQNGAYQQTIH